MFILIKNFLVTISRNQLVKLFSKKGGVEGWGIEFRKDLEYFPESKEDLNKWPSIGKGRN